VLAGTKDAFRIFNKFGLALRVPISWFTYQLKPTVVKVPYLNVVHWIGFLLKRCAPLLLGGYALNDPAANENLLCYWEQYRHYHPDHPVFTRFNAEELGRVVPVMIHGDGGTTLKKEQIEIVNFQPVLGCEQTYKETLKRKHKTFPDCDCPPAKKPCFGRLNCEQTASASRRIKRCRDNNGNTSAACKRRKLLEAQATNNKGSSILTRFLCFAVPSRLYKKHVGLNAQLMHQVGTQLLELFESGVCVDGKQYYVAGCGCKGDMAFHAIGSGFDRSYNHLGENIVRECGVCHVCLAGLRGYRFEDTSDNPAWRATKYVRRPFTKDPPLAIVPYSPTQPEKFCQRRSVSYRKTRIWTEPGGQWYSCLRAPRIFPRRWG
jgi:hypothetical protein